MKDTGKTKINFISPDEVSGIKKLPGMDLPWVDLDCDDDDKLEFLFRYRGSELIAKNNLVLFRGREKGGKSAVCLAFIAAVLRGEFLGIRPLQDDIRIALFDTEQDKGTLREKEKALLRMSGLGGMNKLPRCLKVMWLKGYDEAERLDYVEKGIDFFKPDLAIIDGCADLCESFNDEVKSKKIVNALMRFTEKYGCAVINIIHTNKTSDESLGHLGIMMQRKSAEIYEVKKEPKSGIAIVSQVRSRFAPVADIRFKFADKFEIAQLTEDDIEADKEKVRKMIVDAFAMADQEEVNKGVLCTLLGFKSYRSTGATDVLKKAKRYNLIASRKEGKSILYKRIQNDPETDFAGVVSQEGER